MGENYPVKRWTKKTDTVIGPWWAIQVLLVVVGQAGANFTDFKFTVEPSDVVAVRGKSALLNCSAEHDGSTPLTMQWIRDGIILNIAGETRRTLLPNGSLLFDQVIHSKSHRPDEGEFNCVASIANIGTLVSRKAKLEVAYLAKSFKAEPRDLKVHLGDNAMFSCDIDGLPKPKVTWYRDETIIREQGNINYKFYQDGTLEISNVQFADLGSYKCRTENPERYRDSRSGALTQNSDASSYKGVSPTFIMTPKNQVALEGSTIVFHCGANGRDRQSNLPNITWLKDGTTIDLDDLDSRFRKEGQGSLVIMSVQEQDAGVYTCRASNLEESADADAHLTVHMPPYFRKRPRSTQARQNDDVLFECDVYGIPKPTIRWRKNGDIVIPSDYFQIVDGRNLKILGLVSSDQGLYQCFGENAVGSIQASAQLRIVQQGSPQAEAEELPHAPEGLAAAIVSTRFVTVSWKPPSNEGTSPVTTYSIFWKEEGSNRERVLNTTRIEANIQHLKPATIYEFRVIAYNSKGAGKTAAQTTIRTQNEVNVPGPPTNLKVESLSATSIRLQWGPPVRPNGAISFYKVHYYPKGASQEQNIRVNGLSNTLQGLQMFTEYSFRVVAHNSEGAGLSTDEVSTKTYSGAPTGPPLNFTLETGTSSSIIVRWEPPAEGLRNGIITGFKVRYKKAGDKRGETVTTDGESRVYALTNLERGKEYSIRVQALNVNGSSPPTNWDTTRTLRHDLDESQVPGKPTALTVRPMDTSISVMWTPPREQDIMIRGYYLGYGKGIPDVYTLALDAKRRFYTIKDLEPASEYVISLRAYNQVGQGVPELENVRTREATTPEPLTPIVPPVGLKAMVLSSTTIIVTWSDTTLGLSQQVTDSRYYTVQCINKALGRRTGTINSTDLNVHIDRLKPDTTYEFSVMVTKGRRKSTWSLTVQNKTFEAQPESAPRDVTPVSVPRRPTSVQVNWQPPRLPNGEITGYIIYYTDKRYDTKAAEKLTNGDKLSAVITNLKLNTVYYIKVQARNSKGYGPYSKTKEFRTPNSNGEGGGLMSDVGGRGSSGRGRHPKYKTNSDKNKGDIPKDKETKKGNGMLWIIIASLAAVTLIVIVVVTAVLCRKKMDQNRDGERRNKKGYKPANKAGPKDLKPPDLWIHHEQQMEMKNIDKDERDHRYDPHDEERYKRPIRPKPIMIPVDAQAPPPREPVATVTAIPNGSILGSESSIPTVRPIYPRTQYTMPYASTPRVNAAELTQSSSGPQSPDSPSLHNQHAPIPYDQLHQHQTKPLSSPAQSSDGSKSLPHRVAQPHPLKSFSVPGPPTQSAPGTPGPKQHIVKPQQSQNSPKKNVLCDCPEKTILSSTPVKPRPGMNVNGPQAPDVTMRSNPSDSDIPKSCSTEELSAEMANLEGLMKDLNAITQQEFEC